MDPFGLDTVTIGNDPKGAIAKGLTSCRKSGTICAERYRKAHADERVYELSIGTLPSSKGAETNLHARAVRNDLLGNDFDFGPTINITIDPGNFDNVASDISGLTGRKTEFTMEDAIGHELAGHSGGTLALYDAGQLRRVGKEIRWCDEACARKVDNTFRRERGLKLLW